jgi:hypothetical protein
MLLPPGKRCAHKSPYSLTLTNAITVTSGSLTLESGASLNFKLMMQLSTVIISQSNV